MKKLLLALSLLCAAGASEAQTVSSRGFIHPGGLHTQSDFDRIKQQLADGNKKVTSAYEVLKSAVYAQSGAATYPSETIVRGGSGENYINAARGATIAYQNALRWKIEGNQACAKHAVDVLMKWCNTTKAISGTSDQCLAKGLYGYQFAQAAELMRDYEGWAPEDFAKFQKWMLDVWYPGCMSFLRYRNGTWQNAGKWWQAPGHYWSNWGLCNAMAVISIGILCDDVFIYNQGMSFIKYDQCGTFRDPRTANPILNDGLTEFWGNLIVTTSEWDKETGAYGKVGQMNESGRDTGHAAMAAGLAIDIARTAWSQGDDLFSYMDHRLAAGIEYLAAQCQSVSDLPWTNYHYANNGYYYSDNRSWLMTAPALGAQIRPYWGTVIGIYEGVKGVKMPFSEWAYKRMGIDGGGQGATSGGYDHLGYSVLTNTYGDGNGFWVNPTPPTELTPEITYNGKTVAHNELGGLTNTYETTPVSNRALKPGTTLTLRPCLPEGEEDTGSWQWSTGETTREITVTANQSYVYRVTYTNASGAKSQLCFPIAVLEDTHETTINAVSTSGDITGDSVIVVKPGSSVTLTMQPVDGYGNFIWENGKTTSSITLSNVKNSQEVKGCFQNQGGRKTWKTFRVIVNAYDADASRKVEKGDYLIHHIPTDTYLTREGDAAVLKPLDQVNPLSQAWLITYSMKRYNLVSLTDSMALKANGAMTLVKTAPHKILFAEGADICAISDKNDNYWYVDDAATLHYAGTPLLYAYPFELVSTTVSTAIGDANAAAGSSAYSCSLNGTPATSASHGILINVDDKGKARKVLRQ